MNKLLGTICYEHGRLKSSSSRVEHADGSWTNSRISYNNCGERSLRTDSTFDSNGVLIGEQKFQWFETEWIGLAASRWARPASEPTPTVRQRAARNWWEWLRWPLPSFA